MGILRLLPYLKKKVPNAITKIPLAQLQGESIACDATQSMYQFLVATQSIKHKSDLYELHDIHGNPTAHLLGLFTRALQFLDNGITPIFVFDGQAPALKINELRRRKKLKQEAEFKKVQALQQGDLQVALKMSQRAVRVTPQMKQDCKRMLQLMGIKVIQAPSEAEAQCAYMNSTGIVDATDSSDIDSLAFGAPILLTGFNFKNKPIAQINLSQVLRDLGFTQSEFIDFCLLCGSDYLPKLGKVGPVKAFSLISCFGSLQNALEQLESQNAVAVKKRGTIKFEIPASFLENYEEARAIFTSTQSVLDEEAARDQISRSQSQYDEGALREFLVHEKQFSEIRVTNAIRKLEQLETVQKLKE